MDLFPAGKAARLDAGAREVVLQAEGPCAGWRLVTVSADSPVDVVMTWAGRGSPGLPARFSVCRSGQALVWARSLFVEAVGRSPAPVELFVSAVEVHEHREVWPVLDEAHPPHVVAASFPIPAWAEAVRLDTAEAAQAAARLELLDSDGTVRAAVPGNRQPDWLPLGAAATVRLTCEAPSRLLYRLRLV